MNEPKPGISCIVPVYNEASCIAPTLKGIALAMGGAGRSYELIVVDDGSTDGTLEAATSSGVSFRPIRHSINRGYGAAIKTGCRQSSHPWLLIIDADGTYPTEEIPKLLRQLESEEGADMIVGQRTQTLRTDGFFRLQGKAILTRLSNYLSGIKIPDLNSGLRLMRKSLVERHWPLLPDGFSLTTSITLAILCSGGLVRYVPIEYRRREGRSKIKPMRDMWNFVVLIVRTMIYFNPLKVFLPLGGLLILGAVITVIVSKFLTHRVMDVTSLFLFTAGLQMLLIGVIADLVLKLSVLREK